jgi:hypothetical protein
MAYEKSKKNKSYGSTTLHMAESTCTDSNVNTQRLQIPAHDQETEGGGIISGHFYGSSTIQGECGDKAPLLDAVKEIMYSCILLRYAMSLPDIHHRDGFWGKLAPASLYHQLGHAIGLLVAIYWDETTEKLYINIRLEHYEQSTASGDKE